VPAIWKLVFCVCILGCCTLLFCDAAVQSAWLARVPAKDASRPNPFTSDSRAILGGEKLFQQHCAKCHGTSAEGKKGPGLASSTIRNAKPGELEWLLRNGSLKNGMPSWSRLPEQQRWQLVAYLHTLAKKN
jgi:mono/diheme cytochrome c family protein